MTCKVNGCPIEAEFVTDWRDGKPRYGLCRYHRIANVEDWKITTARIREYQSMIQLFRSIEKIKEPICLQLPGETVREWIDRVNGNLMRVILMADAGGSGDRSFAECYRAIYGDKKP